MHARLQVAFLVGGEAVDYRLVGSLVGRRRLTARSPGGGNAARRSSISTCQRAASRILLARAQRASVP